MPLSGRLTLPSNRWKQGIGCGHAEYLAVVEMRLAGMRAMCRMSIRRFQRATGSTEFQPDRSCLVGNRWQPSAGTVASDVPTACPRVNWVGMDCCTSNAERTCMPCSRAPSQRGLNRSRGHDPVSASDANGSN